MEPGKKNRQRNRCGNDGLNSRHANTVGATDHRLKPLSAKAITTDGANHGRRTLIVVGGKEIDCFHKCSGIDCGFGFEPVGNDCITSQLFGSMKLMTYHPQRRIEPEDRRHNQLQKTNQRIVTLEVDQFVKDQRSHFIVGQLIGQCGRHDHLGTACRKIDEGRNIRIEFPDDWSSSQVISYRFGFHDSLHFFSGWFGPVDQTPEPNDLSGHERKINQTSNPPNHEQEARRSRGRRSREHAKQRSVII